MVIERTFGVWKARFAILANMPIYKINMQTSIVLTTMEVHNYIGNRMLQTMLFKLLNKKLTCRKIQLQAPILVVENLVDKVIMMKLDCKAG